MRARAGQRNTDGATHPRSVGQGIKESAGELKSWRDSGGRSDTERSPAPKRTAGVPLFPWFAHQFLGGGEKIDPLANPENLLSGRAQELATRLDVRSRCGKSRSRRLLNADVVATATATRINNAPTSASPFSNFLVFMIVLPSSDCGNSPQ